MSSWSIISLSYSKILDGVVTGGGGKWLWIPFEIIAINGQFSKLSGVNELNWTLHFWVIIGASITIFSIKWGKPINI